MSFLAMAPDNEHPGMNPGADSSADEAGPVDMASLTGAAALAAIAGPAAGDEEAPLLDPAALQDLDAGLDGPPVARDFARDFTKMWDRRYRSLAAALGSGNEASSLDAVLSLKISSAMVGGIRLSRLAGEVEDAIRCHDMDRARAFLPRVAEQGSETVNGLRAGQDLPDT